jgi:hypothetical protein
MEFHWELWTTILFALSLTGWIAARRRAWRIGRTLSQHARPLTIAEPALKGIVLVDEVNIATIEALMLAETIGRPWIAVHIVRSPARAARALEAWIETFAERGSLYLLPAPWHSRTDSLLQLVLTARRADPDTSVHLIIVGPTIRWWWGKRRYEAWRMEITNTFADMPSVISTDVPAIVQSAQAAATIDGSRLQEQLCLLVPSPVCGLTAAHHTLRRSLQTNVGLWSWVLWLVAVGLFTCWTQAHAQAFHGVVWIGRTIDASLYAVLTLLAREWFVLRWERRRNR